VFGANTDLNAELFLYNVSAGTLTQVTDTTTDSFGDFDNQAPSVSADGAVVAFVSTRDLTGTGSNADGSGELFLYNRLTGTFTQATDSAGGWFASTQGPAISADGGWVAFLSDQDLTASGNTDTGLDYYLYNTSTGAITQLTATPLGGNYSFPRISGDGSRVAFSTSHDLTGGNADGNQEAFLWTAGSGLTQVTSTQNISTPDQADFVEVSSLVTGISASGARLALSSNADLTGGNTDGNLEVFLFGPATGEFTQVTDTANPAGSDLAALNADGTKIALISTADLTGTGTNVDGSQELFLLTVNGVQPPTPGERIDALIADVQALVQAGKLTATQAAALIDKLQTAKKHLEMGRTAKTVHMLQLFQKQVQMYVKDGVLSAADGGALVADAQVIIDELS
jgi:Tol biopolymer transport system component